MAATAVVPSVTEAQLKAAEVREGNEVDVSSQLPCRVAFSRGRERSVAFALCGLPAVIQLTPLGPTTPSLKLQEYLTGTVTKHLLVMEIQPAISALVDSQSIA